MVFIHFSQKIKFKPDIKNSYLNIFLYGLFFTFVRFKYDIIRNLIIQTQFFMRNLHDDLCFMQDTCKEFPSLSTKFF